MLDSLSHFLFVPLILLPIHSSSLLSTNNIYEALAMPGNMLSDSYYLFIDGFIKLIPTGFFLTFQ